MRVIKKQLIHTDSEALTFHESVTCPEVVPLVVDFNDEFVIGRARLYRDLDAGTVTADFYIDKDPDYLAEPPFGLIACQDSKVFTSENGTTYAVEGHFSQVSLFTLGAAQELAEGTIDPEFKDGAAVDEYMSDEMLIPA